MTEPQTEAGKRMLNIPAIRNSYSTAAWVEEICGVEAEATAAAEQRLRERIEALPDTHCPLCVDGDGDAKSGLVLRFSVLNALSDSAAPPAASPRQGEPVEPGLDEAWKAAEAALPEGWRLRVTRTDDDFDVWQASAVSPAFFDGENDNDSDFAHGEGPTPEAALRKLAVALSEPAEP